MFWRNGESSGEMSSDEETLPPTKLLSDKPILTLISVVV